MTDLYTISELAREFDITTRTIRFYEDEGLLQPERNGRQRIYSRRDYIRLKLILRGKRLGLSLSEISDIIELYDSDQGETGQLASFLDSILERRTVLKEQRADICVKWQVELRIEPFVIVARSAEALLMQTLRRTGLRHLLRLALD